MTNRKKNENKRAKVKKKKKKITYTGIIYINYYL